MSCYPTRIPIRPIRIKPITHLDRRSVYVTSSTDKLHPASVTLRNGLRPTWVTQTSKLGNNVTVLVAPSPVSHPANTSGLCKPQRSSPRLKQDGFFEMVAHGRGGACSSDLLEAKVSFAEGKPPPIALQWYRGREGEPYERIPGATALTYMPTADDVNFQVGALSLPTNQDEQARSDEREGCERISDERSDSGWEMSSRRPIPLT